MAAEGAQSLYRMPVRYPRDPSEALLKLSYANARSHNGLDSLGSDPVNSRACPVRNLCLLFASDSCSAALLFREPGSEGC